MNRPKILHVGGVLYWTILTRNPDTMVLKDADSTPTVAVRKNGASTGDSVTINKRTATTGIYDCSYNPAGEVEGDEFTFEESVTITGTTTSSATYRANWDLTVVALERGTNNANTTTPPTAAQNATQVRAELATELGRIDAAVSSRASQELLTLIGTYIDTEIAAIKAKTDNLPSDPADASVIAASFEEIKGTGWSSSTDTLKLIKAATGTASVTVLPLSATDPQRVTGTRISVPMYDRTPLRIPVYDANDDPVDLTALSPYQLRVVIESQQQVDVQIVEHADISVDGGDNNYFTFQPSVAVVSKPANYKWALLHVVSDSPKDNRKKAGGEFVVEYSPGKD